MIHTELTEGQKNFIPLLLEHCDAKKACERTGLDYNIVSGWMKQPQFRAELNYKRRLLCERIMDELANIALNAVRRLDDIVKNESAQHAVKAATAILDNLNKGIDRHQIQTRLDEVEKKLGLNT